MPQTPSTAYVIGIIVFFVLLLVSILIANRIAYESGVTPRDPAKRKLWFWVLAILTPVLTFALAYFIVAIDIKSASKLTKFMNALYISSALSFVLYVLSGFCLSKLFPRTKLGSWF
ncbi:MAG: hypothetical protein II609_02690 [Muribaculaceae bacterium]|nr:hypothetical protein [Muribaculaceae bacterium]